MECEYNDPKCKKEAKHVLRLITIPKSQCQAHLMYKRIGVCQEHGEYLCNDAEFKWEKVHMTVKELEGVSPDSSNRLKPMVSSRQRL